MTHALNYVHIESSTACNAYCRMCPHDKIRRSGTMKYELFTSIVDQAMDLGCNAFTLFRLGEPLLFGDLFKWLDYLKIKNGKVAIYTNGSNFTESVIDKLQDYADIVIDFTISFHGYDKESYEHTMGLDFNRSYDRIRAFLQKTTIPVNIYSLVNNPGDSIYMEKFSKLWKGLPNINNYGLAQYMEWAGAIGGYNTILTDVASGKYKAKRVPCIRVLNEIDVMYDGRVCLCCLDAFGDILFGNLNELTLKEILDHKLRRYYQEKHLSDKADELPLCNKCSTSYVRQ